jgi:hypothetical protein
LTLTYIVLKKIKEKLIIRLESEPFTSTRLALELITVPQRILFGAFSRVLKRIFLCLSYQTHLLKNVIEQIFLDLQTWTNLFGAKLPKHINEEEFEKLTLEEKQVHCTSLYFFIRDQI